MKIRLGGLTTRWIVSVLLTIFIFLVVFNISVGWLCTNYYYNSVYQIMEAHVSVISENFSAYVGATDDEYERAAVAFAEDYENKHLFEVQLFSDESKMIVSTTGFTSGEASFPDYDRAVSLTTNREAVYRGKLSSGENVMAVTMALGSTSRRAVRIITSTEKAKEQITRIILLCVGVSAGLFLIIALTGIVFMRSIVVPVKKISKAAKEISQGNFKTQIETDGKGDMGALCVSINEMANELSAAEQMKNDFISTVSHELRTPLTAIRGWSETVKYAVDDAQIVQKGMEVISAESDRLNTIVEDLLDFSRIQNGALKYDMRNCDVNRSLKEVITAFAEAVHHAGLTLEFKPVSLPEIKADAIRLKQVFVNIIDNSVKNTESGGSITVYEEVTPTDVRIMIRDTGKGIPKEDLEKIKTKFFKSEANKTVRGSGIGLAIADEIIKAHNGSLIVTSELGAGTCVTITLPNEKEI